MSAQDFANLYTAKLAKLNQNSKPIINSLSMVAAESVQFSGTIVRLVVETIVAQAADNRMRYMYLVDSILKNAGGVYLTRFAPHVVGLFCSTYNYGGSKTKRQLLQLLKTWESTQPPLLPEKILTTVRKKVEEKKKQAEIEKKQTNLQRPVVRQHYPAGGRSKQIPRRGTSPAAPDPAVLSMLAKLEREYNRRPDLALYFNDVRQKLASGFDLNECVRLLTEGLKTPFGSNPYQQPPATPAAGTARYQPGTSYSAPQYQQPQPQPYQYQQPQTQYQQPQAVVSQTYYPQPVVPVQPQPVVPIQPQPVVPVQSPSPVSVYVQSQPTSAPQSNFFPSGTQQQQPVYVAPTQPRVANNAPPQPQRANSHEDFMSALHQINAHLKKKSEHEKQVPKPKLKPKPKPKSKPKPKPKSKPKRRPKAKAKKASKKAAPGHHARIALGASKKTRNLFENLRSLNEDIIKSLHNPRYLQCSQCAFRLKGQDQLTKHLDWHYEMKKSKKMAQKKSMGYSRKWFQARNVWENNVDYNAFPIKLFEKPSPTQKRVENVVADLEQKTCLICLDKFDEFFDDDSGVWMYRDAIKVSMDGKIAILHQACREASQKNTPKKTKKQLLLTTSAISRRIPGIKSKPLVKMSDYSHALSAARIPLLRGVGTARLEAPSKPVASFNSKSLKSRMRRDSLFPEPDDSGHKRKSLGDVTTYDLDDTSFSTARKPTEEQKTKKHRISKDLLPFGAA